MIELQNVTKRYPGNREALSHLNLTIEQGEMAFLTGPSGAGKSTLLKLIAAIEKPTRGQVFINRKNIPATYSIEETFDVGMDTGSPIIEDTYAVPFKNEALQKLTVKVGE